MGCLGRSLAAALAASSSSSLPERERERKRIRGRDAGTGISGREDLRALRRIPRGGSAAGLGLYGPGATREKWHISSSLFERVSSLSFDLPLLDEPKPHEKELLRDDEGRVGDDVEEDEESWVAARSAFGRGAALRLLKDGMGTDGTTGKETKRRTVERRRAKGGLG